MARACIVSTWYFETREVWAIEIDDLEGIVRGGQHAIFSLDGETAGPYPVRSLALVSRRLERADTITLVIQAARKDGLARFIGGVVETTDPLYSVASDHSLGPSWSAVAPAA